MEILENNDKKQLKLHEVIDLKYFNVPNDLRALYNYNN